MWTVLCFRPPRSATGDFYFGRWSITSAVTVASVALGDGQLAQQLGEAEADREFQSPLDRNGKLTGLMRSRQPQ